MNLNNDVVNCRLRLGPFHQLRTGWAGSLVGHYDRFHWSAPRIEYMRAIAALYIRYGSGAEVSYSKGECSDAPVGWLCYWETVQKSYTALGRRANGEVALPFSGSDSGNEGIARQLSWRH